MILGSYLSTFAPQNERFTKPIQYIYVRTLHGTYSDQRTRKILRPWFARTRRTEKENCRNACRATRHSDVHRQPEVRNANKVKLTPPHDHQHVPGHFSKSSKEDVRAAIQAALDAKEQWANLPWEQRAAIFLKAADLIAGPFRAELNAATMLGQSKSVYQAEIDSALRNHRLFAFQRAVRKRNLRRAAHQFARHVEPHGVASARRVRVRAYALQLYGHCGQPAHIGSHVWQYRGLKPSDTQVYAAYVLMKIFREAGVPAGVINLIYPSGPEAAEVIFGHTDFAGIHFTGSTAVFQNIWQAIGNNIHKYRTYPRIVGETGGKDFVVAHPDANPKAVITAPYPRGV